MPWPARSDLVAARDLRLEAGIDLRDLLALGGVEPKPDQADDHDCQQHAVLLVPGTSVARGHAMLTNSKTAHTDAAAASGNQLLC